MGHKNMKSRINLNGSRNIKMIFRRRQGRLVDYFLSSSCLFRMVYYVEYMLEKDNGEASEDVGVKGPCIAQPICPLTSFHKNYWNTIGQYLGESAKAVILYL